MQITRIGSRGRLVSFPELDTTNIYLILAPRHTFVCDTFLGPDAMIGVLDLLAEEKRTQPVVVFNSHKDWDHVWGNCAFENATVLATELCRRALESHFADELARHGEHAKGAVVPVFPNLVFTDTLDFQMDEVLFFSSPGHTAGSGSCWDMHDRVLFAGDNVECPLPYIYSTDLCAYQHSLQRIVDLAPDQVICGHGELGTMTSDLVQANLAYVAKLAAGREPDKADWGPQAEQIHQANLAWLASQQ